jgi:hypothetical protein
VSTGDEEEVSEEDEDEEEEYEDGGDEEEDANGVEGTQLPPNLITRLPLAEMPLRLG